MSVLFDTLTMLEPEIAGSHGDFTLFGLFLREDALGLWDLLVAAPWVEEDKPKAIRIISEAVRRALPPSELAKISRIVALETDSPVVEAVQGAIKVAHGAVHLRECNFFGLQIREALIVTAQKTGFTGTPLPDRYSGRALADRTRGEPLPDRHSGKLVSDRSGGTPSADRTAGQPA